VCAALHRLMLDAAAEAAVGAEPTVHFAEGLQFPPELVPGGAASLLTATYVRGAQPAPTWRARWYGAWWYELCMHAAASSSQSPPAVAGADGGAAGAPCVVREDVVPTEDYVFRYDYGAFWMARPMACELLSAARCAYTLPTLCLLLASHWALRPLLGWAYAAARLFRLLHAAPPAAVARKLVVQDFFVPATRAPELIELARANAALSTPLWLCPIAPPAHRPQLLAPHDCAGRSPPHPRIDVAVYGRLPDGSAGAFTAALEECTRLCGGRKMLYARSARVDASDFWADYDRTAYEALRARYGAAGVFPDVCTKACAPHASWVGPLGLGALAEVLASHVL